MSLGARLDATIERARLSVASLYWHLSAYMSGVRPWQRAPGDLADVLSHWEHEATQHMVNAMDRLTSLTADAGIISYDHWVRSGRRHERRIGLAGRPDAFFLPPADLVAELAERGEHRPHLVDEPCPYSTHCCCPGDDDGDIDGNADY